MLPSITGLFALVLSQLVLILGDNTPRKDCEISLLQADKCAITLMFEGDRNRFVPRNEADMVKHCRIAQDNLKCLDKHSKCYPPFPRQIFGTAMQNIRKAYKKRCSAPGKKEFLKHMTCIKSDSQSEPAHQTLDRWTYNMQFIHNNFSKPEHIPASCCAFHVFRNDLLKTVTKLCADTTKDETAHYIEKTISGAIADFMELGCTKYSTLQECRKNFKEGTQILENNVKDGVPKQTTSAMFHFLQIAIKL